ncbi:MAG: adenylate/guanylate cyclase domain-containing protein [Bacteroidia bacterium]
MPQNDFRILYVDDEEQNLISFKATFRREYKVYTANSAQAGLEMLENNPVELIITDQRMPEMTGVQFLGEVRAKFPDTIRMVLTGYSDSDAIVDAINTGRVFRYITKPWDESELRQTIENARELFSLKEKNKTLITELQSQVEQQERTLKLFMKYVPEQVVEHALSTSDEFMFEGEVREITVLFCDIRGFTPLSERLAPRQVVKFLNDYYSYMTEAVKKHGGSVNQFVGDEVFAAFGAPEAIENPETKAVACALDMRRQLLRLNKKYQEDLGEEILIGIGINSGEVVAGNLGSEDKMAYSLTGDTVNTGKRIETLTSEKPNAIYISDKVFDKIDGRFTTRALEKVAVKGKRDLLQIYEVEVSD